MNLLFILLMLVSNPAEELIIKDPWVRPSGKGMATALYFEIENNTQQADTLVKVSYEFAGSVEIHETYKKDDMMGMREIDEIVVEPGKSFKLKPGGHHVMVMKLTKNIGEGNSEKFVLHFKQAGEKTIYAKVKAKN